LRFRVPLAVLLVFVIVLGLLVGVLRYVVTRDYAAIERTDMVQAVSAAQGALLALEEWHRATLIDWARWTDTYDFMAGRNPTYPQENVTAEVVSYLELDFVVHYSLDGRVVLLSALDRGTGQLMQQTAENMKAFAALSGYLRPPVNGDARSGIITIAGRPAVYVTGAITDNEATAPNNGFLVMGAYLGSKQEGEINRLTGYDVQLSLPTSGGSAAADGTDRIGDVVLSYPGRDTIAGRGTIEGPDGEPALWITVTQKRSGAQRSINTLSTVGWAMFGGIVLFALLLGLVLDRTVLRRLARLHVQVTQVGDDSTSAVETVGGTDEITDLAIALDEAVGRARVTEELLRHEADHDHLTGLANRRRLESDVKRLLAEASRTGSEFAILLVDLDGFKAVNDRFGHVCGDTVLCAVARRIEGAVREYSTVARTGGDEFTVLLPHTGRDEAMRVSMRIADGVRDEIPCASGTPTVTASIGLAVFPYDAADMDGLLHVADQDMYARKNGAAERQPR
jgi:diguanylate cyclase (GGDEF)-like protein